MRLNRVEAVLKVLKNIIDVFGSDGEPNGIRPDALIQQFRFGKLRMCCGCRVNYQALYICDICQQREDLEMIYEFPGFLLAASDLKCED